MRIEVNKPRWRAAEAAEISGLSGKNISKLRKRDGLVIGTVEGAEFRFSAVDIAELTILRSLQALGFSNAEAIEGARGQRSNARDLLNNRLVHGFWSVGALVFPGDDCLSAHTLYLDAVGERVIRKLKLPLPLRPRPPRDPGTTARMVDAMFAYAESPSGAARWKRWYAAARERVGITNVDDACAELGVPFWFMRALIKVLQGVDVDDETLPHVHPAIIEKHRQRLGAMPLDGAVLR